MTARVVDLPRVAAALRALDVLVSEHPQLTRDDTPDRCAEWLANEPHDGAEGRDDHDACDLTGDDHDGAEDRAERNTAAAHKPPLEA